MAPIYQKLKSGLSVTENDVDQFSHNITGIFTLKLEEDLQVTPRYIIPKNTDLPTVTV